jgi:hypothetical protein
MEAALRVWQSFYCEGVHARCERYRLHESGREVPRRLLPNGRLLDGPEEVEPAPRRDALGPLPAAPANTPDAAGPTGAATRLRRLP